MSTQTDCDFCFESDESDESESDDSSSLDVESESSFF